MEKIRFNALYSLPALTVLSGAIALAGCAGGSGNAAENLPCQGVASASCLGTMPPPVTSSGSNTGTTTSTGATQRPVSVTVGAPVPASYGPMPELPQYAVSGGPTFNPNDSNLPVANTVFPALSATTAYFSDSVTYSSDSSVTVTVVSEDSSTLKLLFSIPALNITTTANFSNSFVYHRSGYEVYETDYLVLGAWSLPTAGMPQPVNTFAFGYETPVPGMPVIGTASFSGVVEGFLSTPTANNNAFIGGTSTFSVDFASGKISGAFTNMSATDGDLIDVAWHDVSVNASIAAGTSKFSGTTAIASQPPPPTTGSPSPWNLNSSATGHINGGFYGPVAQQLGAIWSLSDGTSSVLGFATAAR